MDKNFLLVLILGKFKKEDIANRNHSLSDKIYKCNDIICKLYFSYNNSNPINKGKYDCNLINLFDVIKLFSYRMYNTYLCTSMLDRLYRKLNKKA